MTHDQSAIAILLVVLVCCCGCDHSAGPRPASGAAGKVEPAATGRTNSGEGFTVVEGRPKVTDDVEREIYKALNHRRKMIAAIKRNSGPDRGIRQMEDELSLGTRGYMSRYGLTNGEIDAILKKGDSNKWE